MPNYRLEWKGAQTRAQVVEAIKSGLGEFGLKHETEAKRELQPGHGVLTGTLRRSIHSAADSYDFAGDDVPPTTSSPDRGGNEVIPQESGGRVVVVVGSGMIYARKMEELYAYMQNSHNRVLPELIPTIQKHAAIKGLA
jgi:hypothetical protein